MKKERKMSHKGFLHKAKFAKSAEAFISAHRDYLVSGEVASMTSPIVAKIDKGDLLPTPGLSELTQAVFTHMLVSETTKGIAQIYKSTEPAKNYVAQLIDSKGNVCSREKENGDIEELIKEFDLPQDALRWIDRRLFDGASDWHGEMIWTKAPATMDNKSIIFREDAIARILHSPKGPMMKKNTVNNSKLGFGTKAAGDKFYFSRG